jgi:hypothetical protein
MPTYSQYQQQQLHGTALTDIGRVGLLMAGLGMGWRGLEGLNNTYRRNTRERPQSLLHADYVDVPTPMKTAGVGDWTASAVGAVGAQLKPFVDPIVDAAKGNVSSGRYLPYYGPAMFGAAGLGAYGGYKLTDHVLDQRRKAESDDELEQARQAYMAALQGGSKLGEALDSLCDTLEEKRAAAGASDYAGVGLQMLGGLLGMGTLSAGLLAYDATRKKRPDDVLEEAKRREARNRMQLRPSPIYARMAPSGSSMTPQRPLV